MTDQIPIHSSVSPNLHPDSLRGESPGAIQGRLALGDLYVASGKLHDLHAIVKNKALLHQKQAMAAMPRPADGVRRKAPPLVYDSAASALVLDQGTPMIAKALRVADNTIKGLQEQVVHLNATIDTKVTAGRNPTRGPEIRAWASRQDSPFLALGPIFADAVNNQTFVAEILLGEHQLVGITADNKAALRSQAADKLAPEEVANRGETQTALDHLSKAAQAFTAEAGALLQSLQSPEAGAIQEILK